jgi:hypothetical protein
VTSVPGSRDEAPKRVQLRRVRGWRKPEGAVVVARPTKWGNPWRVGEPSPWGEHEPLSPADAVEVYRYMISNTDVAVGQIHGWQANPGFTRIARAELAGHDLACWCPLDQPCHADVLLEVANGGRQ